MAILKSYMRAGMRNLLKERTQSAVSVLGVAIGLACALMTFLFLRHQLSYDSQHENASTIYRVAKQIDDGKWWASVSALVGPEVAMEYPSVSYVRFLPRTNLYVHTGADKHFKEQGIAFVDGNVFDVFTYPLMQGNPESALREPYSAVVSSTTARRYFGDENPIGQTLDVDFNGRRQFRVTGVMRDMPDNSHFQFDLLLSLQSLYRDYADYETILTNRLYHNFYTYLHLPDKEIDRYTPVLARIAEKDPGSNPHIEYRLQALRDIHLGSAMTRELKANANMDHIHLIAAAGFLVLLISIFNFMNLYTARSVYRMREAGIRKTVGAHRAQLVAQFLSESTIQSLIALLIALAIAAGTMPVLNDLADVRFRYADLFDPTVVLASLALALTVGVISGIGPALFLSRFEPSYALKGSPKGGNRGARVRNALVICQFVISTSLVITTLVMLEQRSYLLNKQLGFDKEQVLVLPITADIDHKTVKESFLGHPSVLAGTVSTCVPGRDVIAVSVTIRRDGANEDEEFVTPVIYSDLDLVQTFGLKVVQGRGFSAKYSDVGQAMVINETAADLFGWEDPLGKKIRYANRAEISGTVVGVVADFHFASLHQGIEPMVMDARLPWASYISFNVALGEGTVETLAFMREAWREVHPDKPFDFFFLDAEFDRLHSREKAMGALFGVLSSVAIFITCLGLFGLAVFSLERRTKEMGVRKALGASAASVGRLFGLEFVKLLLVATLIAWPLAYWGVHSWMEGFAYRVELGISYFLLGSFLVIVTTLLTISSQAFKASRTNPAELLRIES